MKEVDVSSLEHTSWRCQYHVVFAPKYRRMEIYPLCLVYISIQQQNIAHSIITLSSAGYILSLRLPNKVKT